MAFADPQSVTVNAVAQTLPRIESGSKMSSYRKDDGNYTLTIMHQEGKRNRRTVRLDFRKLAANPFEPSKNETFTGSVYLVIDAPVTGFSNTELRDNALGLAAFCSSATLTRVLGGES